MVEVYRRAAYYMPSWRLAQLNKPFVEPEEEDESVVQLEEEDESVVQPEEEEESVVPRAPLVPLCALM